MKKYHALFCAVLCIMVVSCIIGTEACWHNYSIICVATKIITMNEENKNAGNSSNIESANNENSFKQDDTSVSGTGSNSESAPVSDDYYSVDYVKKDVISTIGDGEMHDEGLVGEGDLATDTPASQDLLSDEQEGAEMQDNEG